MFKYGSRCFDTVREASLYYRIGEKDIIKYLMNNNDMERLIEDLGLDDLVMVNTIYQRDISETISEIQDIYQEYMMLENSDEITFLDCLERDIEELEADLRLASDNVRIISTEEELLETFGNPDYQELNFEHGEGPWGFYTPSRASFILVEEDPSWIISSDPTDPGTLCSDPWLEPNPVYSNPYPCEAEIEHIELVGMGGDHEEVKEAGSWLKFNK